MNVNTVCMRVEFKRYAAMYFYFWHNLSANVSAFVLSYGTLLRSTENEACCNNSHFKQSSYLKKKLLKNQIDSRAA